MSNIGKALQTLESAVSELETVVSCLGQSGGVSGTQPDMFPETKQAVVKSLDKMIAHVETMLEDA